MSAPDSIYQLVEHFDSLRKSYLSGSYKEARLCHDFLDPFIEALGWDVKNQPSLSDEGKQ